MDPRNQNFIFVSFCLVLALGWLYIFSSLGPNWAPESLTQNQLDAVEHQLESQRMKTVLAESHLLDLQVELAQNASQLPSSLAAIYGKFRSPASIAPLDLSGLKFVEAKRLFSERQYRRSRQLLHQLIEEFPASPHVLESRFLWAESLFRTGDVGEGIDAIQEMVIQYPDSHFTGYLLLRLADLYKSKHDNEKVAEIMGVIKAHFPNEKALMRTAELTLSEVTEAPHRTSAPVGVLPVKVRR